VSGSTVSELVVALKPEGVDETVGGLEEAQDSFEETTDVAENQTSQLEAFSERFSGALQVTTTALGVAAGGLLSTVPIIGESFGAIGAIIESLALLIDQTLRPVLGPINASLFKFANRLASLEGPAATVLGIVTTVATALAGFVGLLGGAIFFINSITGASLTLAGVLSTIGGALTTVAAAIGGVIAGISALAAAILIAIGTIVAFAAAYFTNFMDVRDITNSIINSIVRLWSQGFDTLITLAIAGFNIILARANFAFESLVAATKRAGNATVAAFAGWVNAAREIVVQGMNKILDKIESTVNAGLSALSSLPEFDFDPISIADIQAGDDIQAPKPFNPRSRQSIRRGLNARLARSAQRGGQSLQDLAQVISEELDGALPDEISNTLEVDGRRIAEAGSQFRGSDVANKGR
jgi:hypothetical protein